MASTYSNDEQRVSTNSGDSVCGDKYHTKTTSFDSVSSLPYIERARVLALAWEAATSPIALPTILYNLHKVTLLYILQEEWSKLESSIKNELRKNIKGCCEALEAVENEGGSRRLQHLLQISNNPWDHPILNEFIMVDKVPSKEDVEKWCQDEGVAGVLERLRQLCIAGGLGIAMCMARALLTLDSSNDAWRTALDTMLVLLFKKGDTHTLIKEVKVLDSKEVVAVIERLSLKDRSNGRIWKNAHDTAILCAQVLMASYLVNAVEEKKLYALCIQLAKLYANKLEDFPVIVRKLLQTADTSLHIFTICKAVQHQFADSMRPFICELYIRALTTGVNELERQKLRDEKSDDVRSTSHALAEWFISLAEYLFEHKSVNAECILTAFSLYPSKQHYSRVEECSEWMCKKENDSNLDAALTEAVQKIDQLDLVDQSLKESEAASQVKVVKNLPLFSDGIGVDGKGLATHLVSGEVLDSEGLGLSTNVCRDLAVLLSGPRLKMLTWELSWKELSTLCLSYMEDTAEGTKAITKELKFVKLDYSKFEYREPEVHDMYYGIEKGYEHHLEIEEDSTEEDDWECERTPERKRRDSTDSDESYDGKRKSNKQKNKSSKSHGESSKSVIISDKEKKKAKKTEKIKCKVKKKKEDLKGAKSVNIKVKPCKISDRVQQKTSKKNQAVVRTIDLSNMDEVRALVNSTAKKMTKAHSTEAKKTKIVRKVMAIAKKANSSTNYSTSSTSTEKSVVPVTITTPPSGSGSVTNTLSPPKQMLTPIQSAFRLQMDKFEAYKNSHLAKELSNSTERSFGNDQSMCKPQEQPCPFAEELKKTTTELQRMINETKRGNEGHQKIMAEAQRHTAFLEEIKRQIERSNLGATKKVETQDSQSERLQISQNKSAFSIPECQKSPIKQLHEGQNETRLSKDSSVVHTSIVSSQPSHSRTCDSSLSEGKQTAQNILMFSESNVFQYRHVSPVKITPVALQKSIDSRNSLILSHHDGAPSNNIQPTQISQDLIKAENSNPQEHVNAVTPHRSVQTQISHSSTQNRSVANEKKAAKTFYLNPLAVKSFSNSVMNVAGRNSDVQTESVSDQDPFIKLQSLSDVSVHKVQKSARMYQNKLSSVVDRLTSTQSIRSLSSVESLRNASQLASTKVETSPLRSKQSKPQHSVVENHKLLKNEGKIPLTYARKIHDNNAKKQSMNSLSGMDLSQSSTSNSLGLRPMVENRLNTDSRLLDASSSSGRYSNMPVQRSATSNRIPLLKKPIKISTSYLLDDTDISKYLPVSKSAEKSAKRNAWTEKNKPLHFAESHSQSLDSRKNTMGRMDGVKCLHTPLPSFSTFNTLPLTGSNNTFVDNIRASYLPETFDRQISPSNNKTDSIPTSSCVPDRHISNNSSKVATSLKLYRKPKAANKTAAQNIANPISKKSPFSQICHPASDLLQHYEYRFQYPPINKNNTSDNLTELVPKCHESNVSSVITKELNKSEIYFRMLNDVKEHFSAALMLPNEQPCVASIANHDMIPHTSNRNMAELLTKPIVGEIHNTNSLRKQTVTSPKHNYSIENTIDITSDDEVMVINDMGSECTQKNRSEEDGRFSIEKWETVACADEVQHSFKDTMNLLKVEEERSVSRQVNHFRDNSSVHNQSLKALLQSTKHAHSDGDTLDTDDDVIFVKEIKREACESARNKNVETRYSEGIVKEEHVEITNDNSDKIVKHVSTDIVKAEPVLIINDDSVTDVTQVSTKIVKEEPVDIINDDSDKIVEHVSTDFVKEEPAEILNKDSVTVVKQVSTKIVKEEPVEIINDDSVTVVKQVSSKIVKEEHVEIINDDSVTVVKQVSTKIIKEEPIEIINDDSDKIADQVSSNGVKEEPVEIITDDFVKIAEQASSDVVKEESVEITTDDFVKIMEQFSTVVKEEPVEIINDPVKIVEQVSTDVKEEPVQTITGHSVKIVEQVSTNVVEEEPVEIITDDSVKIVEQVSSDVVKEEPVEIITDDSTKIVEQFSSDVVKEEPVEIITDDSIKIVEQVFSDVGKEEPVEIITDDSVTVVKHVSTEIVIEEPVEIINDDPVKIVEQVSTDVKEESVEIITDDSVKIVEQVSTDVKEEPVEIINDPVKIVEQVSTDVKEEPVEIITDPVKIVEQVSTDVKEESVEIITDDSVKIVEQVSTDVKEEPVEIITDPVKIVEQVSTDVKEESVEIITDDSVKIVEQVSTDVKEEPVEIITDPVKIVEQVSTDVKEESVETITEHSVKIVEQVFSDVGKEEPVEIINDDSVTVVKHVSTEIVIEEPVEIINDDSDMTSMNKSIGQGVKTPTNPIINQTPTFMNQNNEIDFTKSITKNLIQVMSTVCESRKLSQARGLESQIIVISSDDEEPPIKKRACIPLKETSIPTRLTARRPAPASLAFIETFQFPNTSRRRSARVKNKRESYFVLAPGMNLTKVSAIPKKHVEKLKMSCSVVLEMENFNELLDRMKHKSCSVALQRENLDDLKKTKCQNDNGSDLEVIENQQFPKQEFSSLSEGEGEGNRPSNPQNRLFVLNSVLNSNFEEEKNSFDESVDNNDKNVNNNNTSMNNNTQTADTNDESVNNNTQTADTNDESVNNNTQTADTNDESVNNNDNTIVEMKVEEIDHPDLHNYSTSSFHRFSKGNCERSTLISEINSALQDIDLGEDFAEEMIVEPQPSVPTPDETSCNTSGDMISLRSESSSEIVSAHDQKECSVVDVGNGIKVESYDKMEDKKYENLTIYNNNDDEIQPTKFESKENFLNDSLSHEMKIESSIGTVCDTEKSVKPNDNMKIMPSCNDEQTDATTDAAKGLCEIVNTNNLKTSHTCPEKSTVNFDFGTLEEKKFNQHRRRSKEEDHFQDVSSSFPSGEHLEINRKRPIRTYTKAKNRKCKMPAIATGANLNLSKTLKVINLRNNGINKDSVTVSEEYSFNRCTIKELLKPDEPHDLNYPTSQNVLSSECSSNDVLDSENFLFNISITTLKQPFPNVNDPRETLYSPIFTEDCNVLTSTPLHDEFMPNRLDFEVSKIRKRRKNAFRQNKISRYDREGFGFRSDREDSSDLHSGRYGGLAALSDSPNPWLPKTLSFVDSHREDADCHEDESKKFNIMQANLENFHNNSEEVIQRVGQIGRDEVTPLSEKLLISELRKAVLKYCHKKSKKKGEKESENVQRILSNVPGMSDFNFLQIPAAKLSLNVVQVGQIQVPVSSSQQSPLSSTSTRSNNTNEFLDVASNDSEFRDRNSDNPSGSNSHVIKEVTSEEATSSEQNLNQNEDSVLECPAATEASDSSVQNSQNVKVENNTHESRQPFVQISSSQETITLNPVARTSSNSISSNACALDGQVQLIFAPQSMIQQNFAATENEESKELSSNLTENNISNTVQTTATTTTTSANFNPVSRAQTLVNILSQKIIRPPASGCITAPQVQMATFPKGTPINALSLQQALAQILPPPLSQTSGEGSQNVSHPTGPQVVHIVQGKASGQPGSSFSGLLMDNSQQSVVNVSGGTQVLHIVQGKNTMAGSNATVLGSSQLSGTSFGGLSLVETGSQQGGNQVLHIVNAGGQVKNSTATAQLLKRVNLLTSLNNEQKMVQFVCKAADGKSIQLNAQHQRGMVLRLQPIEPPTTIACQQKPAENHITTGNHTIIQQGPKKSPMCADQAQEIKSRSIYEENYAKFIQNCKLSPINSEKSSTILPKFNQAFGKSIYQESVSKSDSDTSQSQPVANEPSSQELTSTLGLTQIGQMTNPPLLIRKAQQPGTSQNIVGHVKQGVTPMNIQTMHGGVIYTRQIPVNIGGGQTINLITVPSTELIDEAHLQAIQKQVQEKNTDQHQSQPIEHQVIKLVSQSDQNQQNVTLHVDSSSDDANQSFPEQQQNSINTHPLLTQMRIKVPMLSKGGTQMVTGARVVRPVLQIQRNIIPGTNPQVYQQLVLTTAPALRPQTPAQQPSVRSPRASTATPQQESNLSSSTLEQLREFDMVLEQVKERSTVQPGSNSNSTFSESSPRQNVDSDSNIVQTTVPPTQQREVVYSIGPNHTVNVTYVNKNVLTGNPTVLSTSYPQNQETTTIVNMGQQNAPHIQIGHGLTNSINAQKPTTPTKINSKTMKAKSSKPPSITPSSSKASPVAPKTSVQKPLEDEQTTQRILYILAEYKEQVENSPDKDKPAPRRRSNPPTNPSTSSKRKKGSGSSSKKGSNGQSLQELSPLGDDTGHTMGSEDSSCGLSQGECADNSTQGPDSSPQGSPQKAARKLVFSQEPTEASTPPVTQAQRNVIIADGQTIAMTRPGPGSKATAVLMPANYLLPMSMVKGGQQITIVTNQGPKILNVPQGEGGATNTLFLQRLISPASLKPMLARPGQVRQVRLPATAVQNLQAFNLTTAQNIVTNQEATAWISGQHVLNSQQPKLVVEYNPNVNQDLNPDSVKSEASDVQSLKEENMSISGGSEMATPKHSEASSDDFNSKNRSSDEGIFSSQVDSATDDSIQSTLHNRSEQILHHIQVTKAPTNATVNLIQVHSLNPNEPGKIYSVQNSASLGSLIRLAGKTPLGQTFQTINVQGLNQEMSNVSPDVQECAQNLLLVRKHFDGQYTLSAGSSEPGLRDVEIKNNNLNQLQDLQVPTSPSPSTQQSYGLTQSEQLEDNLTKVDGNVSWSLSANTNRSVVHGSGDSTSPGYVTYSADSPSGLVHQAEQTNMLIRESNNDRRTLRHEYSPDRGSPASSTPRHLYHKMFISSPDKDHHNVQDHLKKDDHSQSSTITLHTSNSPSFTIHHQSSHQLATSVSSGSSSGANNSHQNHQPGSSTAVQHSTSQQHAAKLGDTRTPQHVLRHKYALMEHELRLQKSLSEECEDLGVDSPSASDLFPEADLLFANSPSSQFDHSQDGQNSSAAASSVGNSMNMGNSCNNVAPASSVSTIHSGASVTNTTITLKEENPVDEEFARMHPNTTFHSGEIDILEEQDDLTFRGTAKRSAIRTISGRRNEIVRSVIEGVGSSGMPSIYQPTKLPTHFSLVGVPKRSSINIMSLQSSDDNSEGAEDSMNSAESKDGLVNNKHLDGILNSNITRDVNLSASNSPSCIPSGIIQRNVAQVIRHASDEQMLSDKDNSKLCPDENSSGPQNGPSFMLDNSLDVRQGDSMILKTLMMERDGRDALTCSSPEQHSELFWESNSNSNQSDEHMPHSGTNLLDFSSEDSNKCCKSPPSCEETNSTDSSSIGGMNLNSAKPLRLNSVIKSSGSTSTVADGPILHSALTSNMPIVVQETRKLDLNLHKSDSNTSTSPDAESMDASARRSWGRGLKSCGVRRVLSPRSLSTEINMGAEIETSSSEGVNILTKSGSAAIHSGSSTPEDATVMGRRVSLRGSSHTKRSCHCCPPPSPPLHSANASSSTSGQITPLSGHSNATVVSGSGTSSRVRIRRRPHQTTH